MGVQGAGGGSRPVDTPPPSQTQPTETGKPTGTDKPPPSSSSDAGRGAQDSGAQSGSRGGSMDLGQGPLGGSNPLTQGWADLGAQQSALTNSIMSDQTAQTEQADQQQTQKFSEQERPIDQERAKSNTAENQFMMKSQDMAQTRQRMFQTLMSTQQKSEAWVDKRHTTMAQDNRGAERGDDASTKQSQFFRVRSQVTPGLARDRGEGQQMVFKNMLPPGYNAFMQASPRGKQLFIYSQKPLKGEGMEGKEGEGNLAKMNAKAAKEGGTKQVSQGLLAAQKQLAKQMGLKEGLDQLKEDAEALAMAEEEGGAEGLEDSNDPMAALRKAMGAKASKTKGKGEGDDEVGDEMPWANFGEAIEHHTVLFAGADHAESAELVSQANFAGAIIMGAAIHIRLKGAKLNYSGTSHHGLPIPSGDEALDMGRDQVVAGFERDMGQLGVESVFVNGQRFELANPDDERKLKALVQDNPELYQMIQDIREAIQETRFYRTCLGLTEDGPGGRA